MKFSRLLNISWQETIQLNQNIFFFSEEWCEQKPFFQIFESRKIDIFADWTQ